MDIVPEVPLIKSGLRLLLVAGCTAWCSVAIAQNAGGGAAGAQPPTKSETAAPSPAKPLELADTAPDRYVVQKGDTLWSIATKFLKEPWRWPELWRFNKEQIRDPHLLYPGYVLSLERAGAVPGTGTTPAGAPPSASGAAAPSPTPAGTPGETPEPRLVISDKTVKLSPHTRETPLGPEAIPSIPAAAIEPFLTRPLVVDDEDLDDKPHVIATEEGRYNVGAGDKIYVAGIGESTDRDWALYRRGSPLVDPDTDETITYEAVYLGRARMMKRGDPSILRVLSARQEIGPGDRLIPVTRREPESYVPHAPERPIRARVISVVGNRSDAGLLAAYSPALADSRGDRGYEARREAGPMQLITINKGSRDGLEFGHVLALHRGSQVKFDRSVGPLYMGSLSPAAVPLPEERYGLIFIVRAFDRVSYALVMEASQPLAPGDLALKP